MLLGFSSRELQARGEDGRLAAREWGLEAGRQYIRRMILLEDTPNFSLLFSVRSPRLHKLSGVEEDIYALTIHGRWRLILRKVNENEVIILEVSNHYGD